MNLRWELDIDAVVTEVQPVNSPTLTTEPADDDLFRYYQRPKLSNVVFNSTAYGLLKDKLDSGSPCDDIILTVTRVCNSGDDWSREFVFSVHDCEWNEDNCTVTCKVESNDLYRCISLNWEKEINLFGTVERFNNNAVVLQWTSETFPFQIARFTQNYNLEFVITADNDLPTNDPNQGWSNTRRYTFVGTLDTYYVYFRFVSIIDCEAGVIPVEYTDTFVSGSTDYTLSTSYQVIEDLCATDGVIKIAWDYLYWADGPGQVNTFYPLPELADVFTGGVMDITEVNNFNGSPPGSGASWLLDEIDGYYFWFDPLVNIETGFQNVITFYNGIKLFDAFEEQVEIGCPSINLLKSEFFQVNPDTVDTFNYMTDLFNWWHSDLLMIHQITDVVTPSEFPQNQASKMRYTLRSLFEMVRDIFRAFPTFEGSNLRIEHESYFDQSVIMDLSAIRGRNNYTFDLSEVYSVMQYNWYVANNIDFIGKPMEYGGACTNRESVEVSPRSIATDWMAIYNNEDYTGDVNGIVMFSIFTDAYIHNALGLLSGIQISNGYNSWAWLHTYFHRHNRPLITGTMNGATVNHQSAARIKVQEIITSLCCGDTYTGGLITTELGNGLISKSELDLRTDRIKYTLLHSQNLTT